MQIRLLDTYTRTMAIIHRDFIAYKLPLPHHTLFHGIYLQQQQQKNQQLIDSDGSGRFSPTDLESHDMRRVAAAAKTNRIAFNIFFFSPAYLHPFARSRCAFISDSHHIVQK